MQQFQQLGTFSPCSQQTFSSIDQSLEIENIFIHKLGFPQIVVRPPKAQKKIHCWRLRTLEIIQYNKAQGSSKKSIAEIKFDGEMILTHIKEFNEIMGRQILQYVQDIGPELRQWCEKDIKNIFLVAQRGQESLGFKHVFVRIQPILYHERSVNYFQYKRWIGKPNSKIPVIENQEHVTGSSSFGNMFQYVCQKISKDREMKRKAYQKKLKKIKFLEQKKKREQQQRQNGQLQIQVDPQLQLSPQRKPYADRLPLPSAQVGKFQIKQQQQEQIYKYEKLKYDALRQDYL